MISDVEVIFGGQAKERRVMRRYVDHTILGRPVLPRLDAHIGPRIHWFALA